MLEDEKCLPEDVHILIPGTHEYVTLPGKEDFADVIKFRILMWEIILDYQSRPNIILNKGTWERRAGGSRREDVRIEAEVRKERRYYAAGFEDGRRGHKPKNVGSL